ncbi:MAG: phosphoribosylanthranilate isomerase [Bacteroidota bacterium]
MKKLIKVCGMRESQNIEELSELDIDMMGMIFYPKSPRYIEKVPVLSGELNIDKVGVFVNSNSTEILEKVDEFNLNIVQLHGNEKADCCNDISDSGVVVMKAFGIDEGFDFSVLEEYERSVSMFVFDTKTKDYGGSGKKFNWNKLKEYKGNIPFLLSGGIGPNDIAEVLNFEHPKYAGVDLNSGFEIKPALKNIDLLKEFIKKYRN